MKKNKLLSLLLISSMLVSSCGKSEEKNVESNVSKQEKKEYTILYVTCPTDYLGLQQGWYATLLEDKFNINLSYRLFPYDMNMEDYTNTDLFIFNNQQEYEQAISDGLLLEWDDELLDNYGTNIKNTMKGNIEINKEISGDGKLYGLGVRDMKKGDTDPFINTWDVRWDLYQKIGKPKVDNLEDYKNMLTDIKNLDEKDENGEEMYAVAFLNEDGWDTEGLSYVEAMVTAYQGYNKLGMGFFDVENGEFHGLLGDEKDTSYIDMLKYVNELYRDGLFDPKSKEYSYDDFSKKLQDGGIYSCLCRNYSYEVYNTEKHFRENKIFRPLVPKDAKGVNNIYGTGSGAYYRNFYAIGKDSKNPERVMEYIDYLSTSQGMLETVIGPEGIIWEYDDNGNTKLLVDSESMSETQMPAPYNGTYTSWHSMMYILPWSSSSSNGDNSGVDTYLTDSWITQYEEPFCDADNDWRDSTGCVTPDQYMRKQTYVISYANSYAYLDIQNEEQKPEWKAVSEIIVEKSWDAIYADSDEAFDKTIEEMKSEALDTGYNNCIETCEKIALEKYELECKRKERKD